ncbi:MAG: AAA family ATPase [Leptospiraceae bacterium]|nr:AAA family ATPase [Leptospiraceae bacterium]
MSSLEVNKIKIENFTNFDSQSLDFSSGINVFIGKNGTGKTHILKLIYASLLALKEIEAQKIKYPEAMIQEKLVNCFMPDELQRLIRRGGDTGATGNKTASIEIEISKKKLAYSFNRKNNKIEEIKKPKFSVKNIIYLPPIEMLSIQKGFAAAWKNRENSFDETYYQLANLLDLNPARGPKEEDAKNLLEMIKDKLKASVSKKDNGNFYVKIGGADLESALVGQGLRKIASIIYLINNGTITKDSILFWDEPEAHLNPELSKSVADFIIELSKQGLQIFIASHDYLLTQMLSLKAEFPEKKTKKNGENFSIKFFSLTQETETSATQIEVGDTLLDITSNPILDEFTKYYHYEQNLIHKTGNKK